MPTNGHGATRQAIIVAAENCSPPTITACPARSPDAGQSNTGAVQYHFGDRDGRAAIIAKHRRSTATSPRPARPRVVGVDDLRTSPPRWSPSAANLNITTSARVPAGLGRVLHPRQRSTRIPELGPTDSIARWHKLLDPLVPDEERVMLPPASPPSGLLPRRLRRPRRPRRRYRPSSAPHRPCRRPPVLGAVTIDPAAPRPARRSTFGLTTTWGYARHSDGQGGSMAAHAVTASGTIADERLTADDRETGADEVGRRHRRRVPRRAR